MMNQPPIILITGASRGLGAATAQAAVELGAKVALMARSLDELQAQAEKLGLHNALTVPGDVSRVEDCRRAVASTVELWGRLNGLVNNAGVVRPIAPLADAHPKEWEDNLRINLIGPALLTQAALPFLRTSHGRVIHVSSGAAVKVTPGWSAYCAAKAGLNHFNRVLAAEEPDITTITLRPGVVDTAMQAAVRQEGETGMPDEYHQKYIGYQQQGELLPPEKPGRALAALALAAPHSWSGEFIRWDEERVQELVARLQQ